MEITTLIVTGVILWYVPVIIVTLIVHVFVYKWRILGKASYIPLYGTGLAICLSTFLIMPYLLLLRINLPGFIIVVGYAFFLGGVIFLFWSYITLSWHKLSWRTELESPSSQSTELATSGPYALCRHPVYSAAIIIIFSTFLISGVIFLAVPLLAIYPLIIREEQELTQRFGVTYVNYSKTTPKLLGLYSGNKKI